MSTIPIICQADGTRFTVETVRPDLTCTACGSGDHLDLDEGLATTASVYPCHSCGASMEFNSDKSSECPECGLRYNRLGVPDYDTPKKDSSRKTPPPWVAARKSASFETDQEMGQVGTEPDSVKQHVTCSTCLTDATITASDPAQPMPPCPNCGAKTLSPGGSTLARRAKIAEIAQGIRATNPGMKASTAHRIAAATVERFPVVAERKQAMPNPVDVGVRVGDFFVNSWGYDQTNVDFYEVVGLSPASVKIVPVNKRVVEGDDGPHEKVVPVPGSGGSLAPETKRLRGTSREDAYIPMSHGWCPLWDGQPKYQTGRGYGH